MVALVELFLRKKQMKSQNSLPKKKKVKIAMTDSTGLLSWPLF